MKWAFRGLICRACSRWVCIWSVVITASLRSRAGNFFEQLPETTGILSVFGDVHWEWPAGGAVVRQIPTTYCVARPPRAGAAHRPPVDARSACACRAAARGAGLRTHAHSASFSGSRWSIRARDRPSVGGDPRAARLPALSSGAPSLTSSSSGAVVIHSLAASSSLSLAMPAASGSVQANTPAGERAPAARGRHRRGQEPAQPCESGIVPAGRSDSRSAPAVRAGCPPRPRLPAPRPARDVLSLEGPGSACAGRTSSGGGAGRTSGVAGRCGDYRRQHFRGPGHGTSRAWQTGTRGGSFVDT